VTIGREGILKIYGDTNTLHNNISRHADQVSYQRELAALMKIEEKHVIYFSNRVVNELMKTPEVTRRNKLKGDSEKRTRVANDEKLLRIDTQIGQSTTINCPIMSLVQDQGMLEEFVKRGLDQLDAEHISQAVCNKCNVFLTLDEAIIKRHYAWLKKDFNIRALKPTRLFDLLEGALFFGHLHP